MFEKASRMRLRFDSERGLLTTEDLWKLPLEGNKLCLDKIAKGLYQEIRENSIESFVSKTSSRNKELQLKFDIVKYIIDVRLQEKDSAEKQVQNRQKKEEILSIIKEKESESMKSMNTEQLKALLESLSHSEK
jgi:hypothetical protein